MRRLLTLALAAGLVLGAPAAAWGYHDGDDGGSDSGYRSGQDCRDGGGCHNRRREDYGDNSCKYACPKFDKSPVQDSFNFAPQVCLPGATCYFGDEKKKGDQPPSEGQQPTAAPPACLVPVPFHCDPKPQRAWA